MKLIGDNPWQQLVDAIDGMLGDASDDVAQVGLGIKAIQFGGTNQSSLEVPEPAVRLLRAWADLTKPVKFGWLTSYTSS